MPLIINDPYQFEGVIAELFQKMGYDASVTSKSGDYGVDVIAIKETEIIAIQVKLFSYGNNVGNNYVQKLLGAMQMSSFRANKSILITSSDFTIQAIEQAKATPIELWNGKYIKELLGKYFYNEVVFEFKNTATVINYFKEFPNLEQQVKDDIIANLKKNNNHDAALLLCKKGETTLIGAYRNISEVQKEVQKKLDLHIKFDEDFSVVNVHLSDFPSLNQTNKDTIFDIVRRGDYYNASTLLQTNTNITTKSAQKIIMNIRRDFPHNYLIMSVPGEKRVQLSLFSILKMLW